MATTVSYSASMRTRKTNSASNAKSSAASQEYYENTYNYVGIVHFAGMALSGKVITGISLRIVAAQAGYGTGHTKTVYVRKSNYDLYEPAEQHCDAHAAVFFLFVQWCDCHGRDHLLHMDATRFAGRTNSKRDLRLGHDSVRHLCEWFVGLNQYLCFSADSSRVRCAVHFVHINR